MHEDHEYDGNLFPLAYLLTFRTFGTWLHGDERTSYGRKPQGLYRSKQIVANRPLEEYMQAELKQAPVILDAIQRRIVHEAIIEVCTFRDYRLHGSNVRTNHAHVVASADVKPEKIVNDMKAYATRALRTNLYYLDAKVWARGASTRYLWKPKHLAGAVDYVLYCQEDIPFEFRETGP